MRCSAFFLSLTTAITREGTFWLYAGLGVASLIYFAVVVPETKDRSLEEIEQELGTSGDQDARAAIRPAEARRLARHDARQPM